jgi:hypothetical protein
LVIIEKLYYDARPSKYLDAADSQIYYLAFSGSTYFGRLPAHHQELTTALTASVFTVGAWW